MLAENALPFVTLVAKPVTNARNSALNVREIVQPVMVTSVAATVDCVRNVLKAQQATVMNVIFVVFALTCAQTVVLPAMAVLNSALIVQVTAPNAMVTTVVLNVVNAMTVHPTVLASVKPVCFVLTAQLFVRAVMRAVKTV